MLTEARRPSVQGHSTADDVNKPRPDQTVRCPHTQHHQEGLSPCSFLSYTHTRIIHTMSCMASHRRPLWQPHDPWNTVLPGFAGILFFRYSPFTGSSRDSTAGRKGFVPHSSKNKYMAVQHYPFV